MELASLPTYGIIKTKLKEETHFENGEAVEIRRYNRNGLVSSIETLYESHMSTIEIEYDDNGNEIHTKRADGYERWLEYDENGRLITTTDSSGITTRYEYDSKGNMITVICYDGSKYVNEYNDMNLQTSSKFYDGNGKLVREETREYNDEGNITKFSNIYYDIDEKTIITNYTTTYKYYEEEKEEE